MITSKEKATNIIVDGNFYRLAYNSPVTHGQSSPLVMVGDYPIITIEHNYGVPLEKDIERARIALKTFKASEQKYAYLPDFSITLSAPKQLIVSELNPNSIKSDEYQMQGMHFIVIEAKIADKNWFKFAVFDCVMARKILLLLGKEYSYSCYNTRNHFNLPEIGDAKIKALLTRNT